MKKHKFYSSDDYLLDFYEALANGDEDRVRRVHIPRSDVIYARAHLEAVFDQKFELDYIERCMFLEGMLEAKDVLDPDRKRDFE